MELHAFCHNLYDLFKVVRFLPIVDEFHALSRDLESSMHFWGKSCVLSVLRVFGLLFVHFIEIVHLCQDSGEVHACFENMYDLFKFRRLLQIVGEFHTFF